MKMKSREQTGERGNTEERLSREMLQLLRRRVPFQDEDQARMKVGVTKLQLHARQDLRYSCPCYGSRVEESAGTGSGKS